MYKDVANNLELFKIKYPKTFVPNPSDADYKNGFIERYFIQKVNDKNAQVFEVSENTYSSYISNPYWTSVNIKWRISGPLDVVYKSNGDISDKGVQNSNKILLDIASEKVKNIKLYLPNLLQFYKK